MDQDLKDAIKRIEEVRNRQEKIERIIIFLSGIFIVIVFAIIGIYLYSGKDKTVSEPEVNIVAESVPQSATPVSNEQKVQEQEVSKNQTATPQIKSEPEVNKEDKSKVNDQDIIKKLEEKTASQITAVKPQPKTEKKAQQEKQTKIAQSKPAKKENTKQKESKENQKTKTKVENKKVAKKTEQVNKKSSTKPQVSKKSVVASSLPSGYYIQIGALSSLSNAKKLKKKLNLPNVYIHKEGKLYKVLIGSFKNRKEAYEFKKKHNLSKGFVRKL